MREKENEIESRPVVVVNMNLYSATTIYCV